MKRHHLQTRSMINNNKICTSCKTTEKSKIPPFFRKTSKETMNDKFSKNDKNAVIFNKTTRYKHDNKTTKQKTIIIFFETTKLAHYKNCDKRHKFIMTSIHIYGF